MSNVSTEIKPTSFLSFKELKKSLFTAVWFMILTLPIMVIKVNTIENTVEWHWNRMVFVGLLIFFGSWGWRYLLARREMGPRPRKAESERKRFNLTAILMERKQVRTPTIIILAVMVIVFPFISSMYQTNIMITALNYIILGLGLNIVIGLGGMLHLGYIAFYAVGAYSYALLNYHFGVSFWLALPIGAGLSAIFGILLAIPVLRLRGDYLAIVTLGFGEIVRIILENWNDFSFGPSGIANIPRPGLFGIDFSLPQVTTFIYFIMIGLVVFTIFLMIRLENSRLGRAWVAMREDEVASRAMGIDIRKNKLTAFSLGAVWAGMAGVVFASKTTFINPASFTIWESVMVLSIVVLGGMGSIIGIIIAALIMILLPEYLRAFSEFRMLLFGFLLVAMMVFRPGGLVPAKRKVYTFPQEEAGNE
ncbi:MAG: branched-chain amino acid ABC transporter permease [Spirochaetales bacterium]|nr:branched-chain amino acid ABC transporter permease [Spirochaetales bacterium]MCF7937353.1 branched-chain amino acid ABC transporter permease [Spirochaetales bacterium]